MSDIKLTGVPNIALFGWMGGGKTTAAKLLTEFGYERAAFAGTQRGGVRAVVASIWPDDKGAVTDREKIRGIGEAARALDPEVWLHNYERWLDSRRPDVAPNLPARHPAPVVNDDTRTVAEYQALAGRGWVMVRVAATERELGEPEDLWLERDRTVRRARLQQSGKYQTEEQFDHATEHYLDGYPGDYTIVNDGSITELGDEILKIVLRERNKA